MPDDTNGSSDIVVHDRQTGQTERVNLSSVGVQTSESSGAPAISDNRRFVVFGSDDEGLVSDDDNGVADIFVRDRQTLSMQRVSIASDGTQGDGASSSPYISGDGRFVALDSTTSNLVANDTNGASDVFVHDRQSGQTVGVSLSSAGAEVTSVSLSPSIDPGAARRVSVASGGSQGTVSSQIAFTGVADISSAGQFVVFDSTADELVADDQDKRRDVFSHDVPTGDTRRLSVPPSAGP